MISVGRKLGVLLAAICFVFVFRWAFTQEEFILTGEAMGTTYSITAYGPHWISETDLQVAVDRKMTELIQVFSTYEPESVISLFNLAPVGQPILVPSIFRQVFKQSKLLWQQTGGRWDPTVYPLYVLWGFDRNSPQSIPSEAAIQETLLNVGLDAIQLNHGGMLVKSKPVQLDFSSIAKGFGVDQIALVLSGMGASSFLVEIGGEIRVSYSRPNGQPWRVGITAPRSDAGRAETVDVIEVTHQAVATSGDYRHFFEKDGVRYSHILDPKTGYPVQSDLVSVTMVAPTCMLADGLATAAMVLGQQQTQSLLKAHYPQVEAYYFGHVDN